MCDALDTHNLFKRCNFNDSRYKIFKRYQDKVHVTKWERLHSVHWTSKDITGVGFMIIGKNQMTSQQTSDCFHQLYGTYAGFHVFQMVPSITCKICMQQRAQDHPCLYVFGPCSLKLMAMWRLHMKAALQGLMRDANQQTPKKNGPVFPSQ